MNFLFKNLSMLMALIYINLLPESCNWILSPPIHQINVVITNNPHIFSIDQKKIGKIFALYTTDIVLLFASLNWNLILFDTCCYGFDSGALRRPVYSNTFRQLLPNFSCSICRGWRHTFVNVMTPAPMGHNFGVKIN